MEITLALGDTDNPWIFGKEGIGSPFGTAVNISLKLLRGETTLAQVSQEINQLLEDCDVGHTALQVRFPRNDTARTLAVHWALASSGLLEATQQIATKAQLPRPQQSKSDFAFASVVYDMLNTRLMTFIKNEVIPGLA